MTYENAKIVISGKDVLDSEILDGDTSTSAVTKEKYMKTKYRNYLKPAPVESEKVEFQLPGKNPLIPESYEIYSKVKLNLNIPPVKIQE